MTWKKLSKSSPGDATTFGSDDLDKVSSLFDGTASVDTVDINSTIKIRDQKLRIANSGNTQVSIISSGAASTDKTWTLPNATDTAVGRATTDTLTNKTLTSPIISTIVNTGTLTLPTSTDTLVGRATTDTLTNKTLTTPVISTISNTGTLTLPTSTDTLVGRATTDTLTNKTMQSDANTFGGLMHTPDQKKIGAWMGASNATTGFGTAQGLIATGVGTVSSGTPSVTNGKFLNYLTGATSGNQAGTRIDGSAGFSGHAAVLRGLKGRFKSRFRLNTTGNLRLYLGLHSRTSAYETGDDPINATNGIFLGLRSTDTVFQIAHNDNAGATVFESTSVNVDTNWHTIDIRSNSGDTGWEWSMDGAAFVGTNLTSDVPASGILLYAVCEIETAENVAKNFDMSYAFFETSM